MTVKRSKLEIYLDVLKAIRDGEHRPTRIMYASNLSWKPLKLSLDQMIEKKLVTTETNDGNNRVSYFVTDKAKEIIEYFEHAKTMMDL